MSHFRLNVTITIFYFLSVNYLFISCTTFSHTSYSPSFVLQGTLRNLAAAEQNKIAIMKAGGIGRLVRLAARPGSTHAALAEATAALAVIALNDEVKHEMATLEGGRVVDVLLRLTDCPNPEVQCNSAGALGNLATNRKHTTLHSLIH